MGVPLIDLKAQYRSLRTEIEPAVARIFENGSFILGAEVERFESAFADYCGARHAVGVSSGTAALDLTLLAAGIGAGDEVITTPMTFIATASAIVHVGGRPVFADINPGTCNLDPQRLEDAITPRTRAILPVHLYGQPCEMDAILEIARRHDLLVIEDACQAVGATYRGRKAGHLGDVGCFSFYPSKNLGAAGDGGMVATDNDQIAERVRLLRDHGRTSHYGHAIIGYTHRLDALQAAVLGVKLEHLDDWNEKRREHAAVYTALLQDTDLVLPEEAEGCRSVYHIYALRTPKRDSVLAKLRGQDIGASIHYPLPVHLQPGCAHLGIAAGSYPLAEECARTEISLPIYPEMTLDQIELVASTLKSIVV